MSFLRTHHKDEHDTNTDIQPATSLDPSSDDDANTSFGNPEEVNMSSPRAHHKDEHDTNTELQPPTPLPFHNLAEIPKNTMSCPEYDVDNGSMTSAQSMPSSGSSDPSSDGDANTSFVRPPLDPTAANMKKFRRALTRQITLKPTTEAMLEEALKIYDIEKGCEILTPDALSALERVFGLEGIQWPSDRERMYMLSAKVKTSINMLIGRLGYCRTATYGDNHRLRMEIMSGPGKPPPPLPDFLRIPYIVPVKYAKFEIIYDTCINRGIQPGSPLHPKADGSITHNDSLVGTLGVVMTDQKGTYVALTAGHIMNDWDRTMVVKKPYNGSDIKLDVANCSVRVHGRPRERREKSAGFQDDCAFLKIDKSDLAEFDHLLPCSNAHYFEFLNTSDENLSDPVSTSRKESLDALLSINRIVVWKHGAVSSLTMGYFERILDESPEGWYDGGKEHDESVEKDRDEWLGCVRWISDDSPFAVPGDSGSLVFARERGITIPLGIHVGSPPSMPGYSIFISIETYCFEAEKEGWELVFPRR
ncbi:hypothetical protein MMC07_000758 [Pseudocyphellaria aurata]|nr:hypothetical protein [Pseudocyphellaria aurata]